MFMASIISICFFEIQGKPFCNVLTVLLRFFWQMYIQFGCFECKSSFSFTDYDMLSKVKRKLPEGTKLYLVSEVWVFLVSTLQ